MNIKNMTILLVDCFCMKKADVQNIAYTTFDNIEQLVKELNNHLSQSTTLSYSLHSVDEFFNTMNNKGGYKCDYWYVPIFINNANYELSPALMEKLSSEERNALKSQENGLKTDFCKQLDKVYLDAITEVSELMDKNGGSISYDNSIYTIKNHQLYCNGDALLDSDYYVCDILDKLKKTYTMNKAVEELKANMLSRGVDAMTSFLRDINYFNEDEVICEYTPLSIGTLIKDATNKGYEVTLSIQKDCNKFIYGHLEDDDFLIRGIDSLDYIDFKGVYYTIIDDKSNSERYKDFCKTL